MNDDVVDILQEVGNIGIGNAATALAEFLNAKVNVTVPRASLVPVEEVFDHIGGVEEIVAAVLLRVEGDLSGTVLFVFSEGSVLKLISQLLGQPIGSLEEIGGMGESVLMEVGNILTGSFLNAISMMSNLTIIPAVPLFTFDMLGSIISSSLLGTGMMEDQVLLIETKLAQEGDEVTGNLLFFFDVGTLNSLLNSLQVQLESL
ncbi:chemotaxis protein CheC [Thermodesulfitimonas autotrophica]|uniref:Chemotaxis protein CheC n=1 Tax=Thermodesulfitimonas autotrophica TaxID=1894989 RepID=A0A3N5BFW9_9THEO|nr:chemotaxis protein CheC [Thermodesulfitimonas autotrophica]RPF42941.1 chemotaxis protein CheC [Thermodesulfitimonas autotrophica]